MVDFRRAVSRRAFLKGTAMLAVGAAGLPAFSGLRLLAENGRTYAANNGGYGPLSPTPDLRDGVERIALPQGFQYRSFHVAGELMSDGNRAPIAHDGMGSFVMRSGKLRLVCNHEDRNGPGAGTTAFTQGAGYDERAGGGTTTLVVDPITRELERSFLSLNGTIVNCAGGTTPWGSWLSGEESNQGTAEGWDRQHGYVFEVPAAAECPVRALPLKALGRFSHEAVAVDPRTGAVYETEDHGNDNSGFYRFLPHQPGDLRQGGKLQLLAIDGRDRYDTMSGQTIGESLPVRWVAIPDPDPADPAGDAVWSQGRAAGGAAFARLEGMWYGGGSFYFAATTGGNAGLGQIWEYRPAPGDGVLKLVFEAPPIPPPGPDGRRYTVLHSPDHLTVSPNGSLLICEDPPDAGSVDHFYLRGLTENGEIFDFAYQNRTHFDWAGANFASVVAGTNRRRETTLFVNIQGPVDGPLPEPGAGQGMTLAIWGPWERGPL